MIRSEETGSIHGTFKLISSLKARTMQRENSSRRKGDDTVRSTDCKDMEGCKELWEIAI